MSTATEKLDAMQASAANPTLGPWPFQPWGEQNQNGELGRAPGGE